MDGNSIEALITLNTKYIVLDYASVAYNMDKVMSIAEKNKL